MTDQRLRLARLGERYVAWYLRLRGYRVLARNLRTPVAEVDLLVRRASELVVVEVKTRRGRQEVVLRDEQKRRLARAALWVWPRFSGTEARVRIDLAVVRLPERGLGLPRVEYVCSAFGDEVL